MLFGLGNRIGNAVFRKQIRPQSESIPADIGVVIAGMNVLIGIALIIAFI